MSRRRRVTLRCACEDLKKDWSTASDYRGIQAVREAVRRSLAQTGSHGEIAAALRLLPVTNQLRHPLILAFETQFSAEDDSALLRQTISSVSDRQWLKQTYGSRWRGAAVIVTTGDQETAWLGAAGYHRADSIEDFYNWFATECADSSDKFLPGDEDVELLKVDNKILKRDAWMAQTHLSVQVLLANALDFGSAGPLSIPRVTKSDEDLLNITITTESISEESQSLTEVFVNVLPNDPQFTLEQNEATRIILGAIDEMSTSWRSTPLEGYEVLHSIVATEATISRAHEARSTGQISDEDIPGRIRLGTIAHYAPRSGLTDATLAGHPVLAICGHWFVPMHDHEPLEVCVPCADARDRLPA